MQRVCGQHFLSCETTSDRRRYWIYRKEVFQDEILSYFCALYFCLKILLRLIKFFAMWSSHLRKPIYIRSLNAQFINNNNLKKATGKSYRLVILTAPFTPIRNAIWTKISVTSCHSWICKQYQCTPTLSSGGCDNQARIRYELNKSRTIGQTRNR